MSDRAIYRLRHDEIGYTLIRWHRGGEEVLGHVDMYRPEDVILSGPWAPAPEHSSVPRGLNARQVLLIGCERIGLDPAEIEPQDEVSMQLISDALGLPA